MLHIQIEINVFIDYSAYVLFIVTQSSDLDLQST